jgi:hypothetical protein
VVFEQALCKNRSLLSLDLSGVGLCREGLEVPLRFISSLLAFYLLNVLLVYVYRVWKHLLLRSVTIAR